MNLDQIYGGKRSERDRNLVMLKKMIRYVLYVRPLR